MNFFHVEQRRAQIKPIRTPATALAVAAIAGIERRNYLFDASLKKILSA
ncbi:MAG: hypothetical protein ABSA79_10870 [Candidatus Bathyarchaeia archaeon]